MFKFKSMKNKIVVILMPLGFCFLNEAEAKLWIKQHPISKDESYKIVPFEKYEVRKSTNILEE